VYIPQGIPQGVPRGVYHWVYLRVWYTRVITSQGVVYRVIASQGVYTSLGVPQGGVCLPMCTSGWGMYATVGPKVGMYATVGPKVGILFPCVSVGGVSSSHVCP